MSGNEARDVLEVDVVFVGGGPAGLAGALRLTQLIENHKQGGSSSLGDISIAVLETSRLSRLSMAATVKGTVRSTLPEISR